MTGKNKKKHYTIMKAIRITKEQEEKWDPNNIRHFLSSNFKSSNDTRLLDKLVLLMIRAGVNSENYDIHIAEEDINSSIKRLQKEGKI